MVLYYSLYGYFLLSSCSDQYGWWFSSRKEENGDYAFSAREESKVDYGHQESVDLVTKVYEEQVS